MSDFEMMLEHVYRGFLHAGDVCVDVGAHEGRHTKPMADCCGPEGRILAFEPIPTLAAKLYEQTHEDAALGIVQVEQCALSDTTGETEFVLVLEAPGYSGLRERTYDQAVTTERLKVKTRRMDEFCRELDGLRYIKIDCEGGELLVLRGGRETIAKHRPIISFECGDASLVNYDHTSADIYDFFEAMDYQIVSIVGDELSKPDFVQASSRQSFWDYLAYPR